VLICRSDGAVDGIVRPGNGGRPDAEEAVIKSGDKIVSMVPAAGLLTEYKDGDDGSTFNPVADGSTFNPVPRQATLGR
jgi:hypothetical protein